VKKISLNLLGEEFKEFKGTLLIGLGFDQRCLSALPHFPLDKASNIVGVSNAGWSEQNRDNIRKFSSLAGPNSLVIGNNAQTVIEVADQITPQLVLALEGPEPQIAIDITSLSHELLVIILGILNELNGIECTTLVYVGAKAYSTNTPSNAMWLSRGVKEVRSILGFPGTMLPSKKLHLIILTGFEVERASEVISRYEPASISIGLGAKTQSISETHHSKNKEFFDGIAKFVASQDYGTNEVSSFSFSCVSPHQTKSQLIAHIEELGGFSNRNYVICPLNTKLSTVGVALAALDYPELQICYAEPDEYNSSGYATPDSVATIVKLG
jgi:hypothetical protein